MVESCASNRMSGSGMFMRERSLFCLTCEIVCLTLAARLGAAFRGGVMAMPAVATSSEKRARQAILASLAQNRYSPLELMEEIEEAEGLSDAVVRDVIWVLIEERKVELSPDQKLSLLQRVRNRR